jgi:hypothetical protein
MDRRFAADEWVTLSVEERIRRCRLMATEAYSLAATERIHISEAYNDLAKQWESLANEMEMQLKSRPV